MRESVLNRSKCLEFDVYQINDESNEIRNALYVKCNRAKLIILHARFGKDSEFEGGCKTRGKPLGKKTP